MKFLGINFGGGEADPPTPTFDTDAGLRKLRSQNTLFQVNAFGSPDEQDAIDQFYTPEEVENVQPKVLQRNMSQSLHLCRSCGNMHARNEEC